MAGEGIQNLAHLLGALNRGQHTGPRFKAVSSEGPPPFGVANEGWVGGGYPHIYRIFSNTMSEGELCFKFFKDICYIPITAFRTNSSEVCKQI